MSWDEGEPQSRPCPCRKGTYTVSFRSDDWGRFEERWEMQCSHCKVEYALYTYYENRKGLTETHHGWAPAGLTRELADVRTRTEAEKERLAEYAQTHYCKRWNQHFSGKAKKAIWGELTRDGQTYPQLSTFYSHVRHSGLVRVLNRYFHYPDLLTVVRVLGIKDDRLMSMIKVIQTLERNAARQDRNVRQRCVA